MSSENPEYIGRLTDEPLPYVDPPDPIEEMLKQDAIDTQAMLDTHLEEVKGVMSTWHEKITQTNTEHLEGVKSLITTELVNTIDTMVKTINILEERITTLERRVRAIDAR